MDDKARRSKDVGEEVKEGEEREEREEGKRRRERDGDGDDEDGEKKKKKERKENGRKRIVYKGNESKGPKQKIGAVALDLLWPCVLDH